MSIRIGPLILWDNDWILRRTLSYSAVLLGRNEEKELAYSTSFC